MEKKKYSNGIKEVLHNRMIILFASFMLFFVILMVRLYYLQIIVGKENAASVTAAIVRTVPIPAQRGCIYDRYGRPLAVNKVSYSAKFDASITVKDFSAVMLDFFHVLDEKGGTYIDTLPITTEEPYTFTFQSDSAERIWKKDMGLESTDMAAGELLDYLAERFNIPSDLSTEDARKLLSVQCQMYFMRYRKYNALTLVKDLPPEMIAVLEEEKERFPGIYIEEDSYRFYPEGDTLSHILGYVGNINETELEEYSQYGYTGNDVIGKLGIEKACELLLRGQDGQKVIEVDVLGKRVNEIQTLQPETGGDVILTIDSALQQKVAVIMKENLKRNLLMDMDSGKTTSRQIFQSLVNSNAISVKKIMAAEPTQAQYAVQKIIWEAYPSLDIKKQEDVDAAKAVIIDAIGTGSLTEMQMLLCMEEQNKITLTEEEKLQLTQRQRSSYSVLRQKIELEELPISDINLDPCTGAAAVVDIHTGEVLAAVTYPSYDNNRLTNVFDIDYYTTLLEDPNTPLVNRPFMQRKAPGSVLKMLVAAAALETGTITENTVIQDKGEFRDVGKPYAKCLIYSRYGSTHGAVDVIKAIEVSCNYFFYETAARFGSAAEGTTLQAIEILDDYMEQFGLGAPSGVEIEEASPKMATPETKKEAILAYNSDASPAQTAWMDGDTIRSAIGQSYNAYTVLHIAKYIAALANGGTRYRLHTILQTQNGTGWDIKESMIEADLQLEETTVRLVLEGMHQVTTGSQGTLRHYFKDFPIEIGAKTGTAEEVDSRPSHSWFAGFAPYENPQIVVVVLIPYGETAAAPATKIAQEAFIQYFNLYPKEEQSRFFTNKLAK